jgi:hypothetical protein
MDVEDAVLEAELKGKTLMVYMYIIKSDEDGVGVREVQRALNFSSPSVASYHLNKLQDLGLVENKYGDYFLIREIKVGILKQFISLGGLMLPRYLFYAVLLSSMFLTFIIRFPIILNSQYFASVLMGLIPTIILWYETIKIWNEKPI